MQANKGQSTVEYILLITAVIGVVILFTAGKGSLFQTRINSVLDTTTQDLLNVASRLGTTAASTASTSCYSGIGPPAPGETVCPGNSLAP